MIYLVFALGGASLFPTAPDGEGALGRERGDAFEAAAPSRRGFPRRRRVRERGRDMAKQNPRGSP